MRKLLVQNRFKILFFCALVSYSCSNKIILPVYDKNEKIELANYYGRYCVLRFFTYKCDDDLFLSEVLEGKTREKIQAFFVNAQLSIVLDTLKNQYSKNIWLHRKENKFFKHNMIDTNYIVNNVNSNNKTVLVPIFHIYENYSSSRNGLYYGVKHALSIIILKNKKIIYANSRRGRTKRILYHDIEELGEEISILNIHELVDIDKMINKTLEKVMRPYIKRLK
jgi:hypothetical protein